MSQSVNSAEELQEIFLSKQPVRTYCGDGYRAFRMPSQDGVSSLRLTRSGIISHEVDDQVMTCYANTSIVEIQEELTSHGYCLPFLPYAPTFEAESTLGQVAGSAAGHLAMNLPHAFEGSCGSWKDWILGAKVLLSDGTIASSGSKAVKNVAGYDVHKFLVGSRGALCVFLELTLRTLPLKALPTPDLKVFGAVGSSSGAIIRTLPSHFKQVVEGSENLAALHATTNTVYRKLLAGESLTRTESDWLIGWGLGSNNLEPMTGPHLHYWQRAKQIFDPLGLLNPGEFGS